MVRVLSTINEFVLKNVFLYIIFFSVTLSSCGFYKFNGIDIPSDVKTYYVDNFQLTAQNAPGDLNQRFAEALRAKVRNESRLLYREENADIEFSGTITDFTLIPEAPQAGNTVALNRFEIRVSVTYTNNVDEAKSWKQTFSFFKTFASDQDFLSLQESLINDIFKQIMEDIFNKAFAGW